MFEDKNCKEGCLLGNFAAEISDRSELGRETISECFNDWRDMLKEVIARGQEHNSIRDDIAAGEIADFLLNSIEGSILRMKIEGNTDSLKQFREIFLNYVVGKYH